MPRENLKAYLESLGITKDIINEPQAAETTPAAKEMNTLAAEYTLLSLNWPLVERVRKDCSLLSCGKTFLTDYKSVGYCSNRCRIEALKKYGLAWFDKSARNQWGGMQPPGIIPPDALEAMATVLRQAGYEVVGNEVNEDPSSNPPEKNSPKPELIEGFLVQPQAKELIRQPEPEPIQQLSATPEPSLVDTLDVDSFLESFDDLF